MAIINIVMYPAGLVGVNPSWVYIDTNDTLAVVTTANYLTQANALGFFFNNKQMALVNTVEGVSILSIVVSGGNTSLVSAALDINVIAGYNGAAGFFQSYPPTPNKGSLKVYASDNTGNTITNITNAAFGQATTLTIPDPGAASASFLLSASAGSQTIAVTTASPTPGTIGSIIGSMTSTNATLTTGNLVGVRGVVTAVGASGGFFYGVQGKVGASGTLSGSNWTAGVFGQLDISAGTINAGQTAPIWADYGATSGTISDASGMRMFSGTNNTAATLNAMIYLYGKTSNLLELDANGSTYISTGGATASGTIKKIAILIEGVQYYLQAATVYS